MGGCCTLLALISFVGFAILSFIEIKNRNLPYISRQDEIFPSVENGQVIKMNFTEGYKIVLAILDSQHNTYAINNSIAMLSAFVYSVPGTNKIS